MPPPITHEDLVALFDVIKRPDDYFPYGQNMDRESSSDQEYRGDCSCGCTWFAPLDGALRTDWGVCTNRASHRCGLLTFEHQGCRHFEEDPELHAKWEWEAAESRERMRIERPDLYRRLYGTQPGQPDAMDLVVDLMPTEATPEEPRDPDTPVNLHPLEITRSRESLRELMDAVGKQADKHGLTEDHVHELLREAVESHDGRDDPPHIAECTPVVLLTDLPYYNLQAGDVGTVAAIIGEGLYTVEFASLAGHIVAVTALVSSQLRPVGRDEIPHVRSVSHPQAPEQQG